MPEDIREEVDKLQDSQEKNSSRLKELRRKYDITTYNGVRMSTIRRRMQIVYQDPTTSLDPRALVKDIVAEPLIVQGLVKRSERKKKVLEMLDRVGLTERHYYRYPHEFSGGQRQRIAVARALVTNPDFVVLDEPTSSVDVSVRAQLLNLFQDLQKSLNLTYLFVSHDLSVVECIAHRVAVMYLGKIVEQAQTEELFKNPLHPYAQALFSSIPIPDPTVKRKQIVLTGEVPSPINPPSGCRFHPRCPVAMEICSREEPQLEDVKTRQILRETKDVGNRHIVACWLVNPRT
jgi:oligopeptide/dipeptide ABC transporter ATP-binding protein